MRRSIRAMYWSWAALIVALVASAAGEDTAAILRIDADYPGGNILLEKIDGETVHIAQDIRDTSEWWFYYNFRVRGGAGREVFFRWTNENPMAALGPAVSTDGGQSWKWLGPERLDGASFSYRFADDADEVRFCLAMPYQLANLEQFVAHRQNNPHFRQALHATSRKGRPIYRLHVGQLSGEPQHRILLTARHHACEMMASYVLEGVIDAFLADTDDGRWLRQNVELLAVPIMDVDGVEDGDQGKLRRPHDHNRDYEGTPLYPSVAANKQFIPQWSENKLRVALDLHCPWVRGGGDNPGSDEQIYFVGTPNQKAWQETIELSRILEESQTGPLLYAARHNLPWGRSWNNSPPDDMRSFSRWATSLPGVQVASTIEFPYAVAGGQPVTPDAARAFGNDLATALRLYLQRLEP
jgi:hypothetical protein